MCFKPCWVRRARRGITRTHYCPVDTSTVSQNTSKCVAQSWICTLNLAMAAHRRLNRNHDRTTSRELQGHRWPVLAIGPTGRIRAPCMPSCVSVFLRRSTCMPALFTEACACSSECSLLCIVLKYSYFVGRGREKVLTRELSDMSDSQCV